MNEHGQVCLLDHGQNLGNPFQGTGICDGAGRDLKTMHPGVLQGQSQAGQIGFGHLGRGPDAVPVDAITFEVIGGAVPRVEEGGRLVGAHGLDPQGAGQGEQGQVDAVCCITPATGPKVVMAGVQVAGWFALEVQGPSNEPGRGAPPPELFDERFGPEVLVTVDGHPVDDGIGGRGEALHIASEALHPHNCKPAAYAHVVPKRPTLQDVADSVGLAPATVSYALRGERGSEATISRVRAAAQELGYQGNAIAAALASGRSRTVAILCGSTRDLWQQSLAAGLSRALMDQGRHALVADADGHADQEEALLANLLDQRADGLLVAPLDPFAPMWETYAQRIPVVSIGDRLSEAPSAGAVVFDNAAGFSIVFEHLARLGHRRIAVILPQRPSTPDRPAEELVEREGRRLGIETILVRTPPATADRHATTQHLVSVLTASDPPTAAFCLSDSFALGVLRAARELGIDVPSQLSIVGFEDLEFADVAGPGLTSVDWGRGAVVEAAVGQLLASIDRDEPARITTIAPRLVVRHTTAPRR